MIKLLALLTLSVTLLISCHRTDYRNGETLLFQDITEAASLKVYDAQTAVFESEDSWEDFWEENVPGIGSADKRPPPPAVNFDENILIAVFWGGNGYGGCTSYAKAIQKVKSSNAMVSVHVGKLPDLGPCRMIVHPLQVIKVESTGLAVVFKGHVPKNP